MNCSRFVRIRRRSLTATLAAIAILVAACGSDDSDVGDVHAVQQEAPDPWTVPAELFSVVAGDDSGWVRDTNEKIWHVDSGGHVEDTGVVLDAERVSFGTFFAGHVVFGVVRCADGLDGEDCDGDVVGELVVLDEKGELTEVIEVSRTSDSLRSGGGARLMGVRGDRLLLSSSDGWLELDANLELSTSEVVSPPGNGPTCLVDGELYTAQGVSDEARDGDDVPAEESAEGEPDWMTVDREWAIHTWNDGDWEPVDAETYRWQGESAAAECLANGFIVRLDTSYEPVATWTPEAGWHEPGPTLAELDLDPQYSPDLHLTDLQTAYVATEGTVQRLDLDNDLVPTDLSEPLVSDAATGAEIDDSGTVLFACGDDGPDTRCWIAPKS